MNNTIYRFLRVHAGKLFLSRGKKFSYVWTLISHNHTRDLAPSVIRPEVKVWRHNRLVATLLLMLCVNIAWGQITPTTDTSNPVYYLFQSFGNTSFYMRPNNNNTNAAVSTSNILTDDMKWYFLESGESGYYYICDKDGNYLYFSRPSGSQSSRTWMELKSLDNNDTDHYKFSIAKNNTKGWDAYNIIPYGNADNYCLNKQGRNAGTGNVQVSNGWDDENSNWVFILLTDYEWTLRADCFRPSDSSNKYYYQIKSKKDARYYIKPGTNYVGTSNTVDDDMIWYFEEASSDDYMTYYYIRLANTGQYLKYRNNGDDAIQLANHTGSETGDAEDSFQFIVVRGAVSNETWNTTDISYNIVPKLLKRTNDNINFYCVSSNKGLGKPLKILNDRASTDNKWTFVSVDFPAICAKPTITFSNTTGKASITTTTTRSTIYYTTDGSEPSSSNGTVYTKPFAVNEQTTIKAFVTRTDFSDSEVTTKTIYKVATPSIENTEASVISISTATSGATIYYTTDGSTPTTSSIQYTEPVTITASSVTIKAIAVKDGMINSAVSTESFAFACATPTISFDNTTNTVTIASETGSTIYYAYGSTDPADPTVDEGVAHGSSPVSFPISAKTYIKALAVKEGLGNSAVQSVMIDKVSAPVIDVTGDNKVKLTSSTPGVTIYYEIGDDASSVATPTTSSTRYTSPLSNVTGKVIKAIAVKDGWITSDIGGSEGPITLKCAMPVIRRGIGNTFTISCGFPVEGVHIYYTTGNGDPTTLYEGPVSIATYPVTVKAVARADGYNDSSLAEETITQDLAQDDGYYLIASAGDFEKFVTMANSTGAGDKYKVVDNFTVSGNTAVSTTFTGTFEGGFDDESGEYFTITGLRQPLFNSTNNAVIKNIILDNVSISSGTNVGAICGEATGNTRIYNCGVLGGSVGGSDNVGGIVGLLDGNARVINCYNYANITSGTNCGGIVGYNNVASSSGNLQTMVMNCMFYGNITGGNAAPIYGGAIIHNKYASANDTGLNNYCYFLYDEEKNPYVKTIADDKYHGALGAEERYLNRFEFFRMTLNSTRNLAAYYATGDATQKGEIAKWVLDKSIAPYPILKVQDKYPSVVNPDAAHATAQTERNKGGLLGTLSVTISGTGSGAVFSAPSGASITTGSLDLNITDKDYDNFNFNYKKVQLPYYNEVGTGNYTGGLVVTGWKITSITGGTPGSFTTDTYDYPDFNFVDRKCTNKDLYSVSGRVFAQGAYWEVPDGVTAITIEPYWAKAVYLSDANYDMTYTITISGSGSDAVATANKYGVTVCGSCPTDYNGQTVYTDLSTAITNLGSNADHKVYDYAVVLVGNYHQASDNALVNNGGNPVTFMSADLDGDNEPDNTLFYYHNQRKVVSPIRFDFLNIPGIGMVKRTYDSSMAPEPGILAPKGWFEITNTVFIRFGQFEYAGSNSATKTILAPLILQGGIYEQFVSCCRTNAQNTNYLLIGGNAWFLNFANGCHTAQKNTTPKVPINVTGGDYTNFYLTGIYQPTTNEASANAECYIDGGRFTEVAGAGMQKIKGDVTWLINAADITSFFGGGINAAQAITGSISTTISNSYVDEFYGGPKFGDMSNNKTVTTNATDCHFGKYFGAGYGGTAFNRVGYVDDSKNHNTKDWDGYVNSYYKRAYSADNSGISTNYEYEFILHSDGNQTVARFFVNYASLSLASTRNVTNTLSGCTIGTFYGGGSLGAVNGDVNSTLTDCTVTGNAFGAGFSASVPTVEVWNANAYLDPKPTYNRTANVFNNASVKTPKDNGQYVVYTWSKTHGSNTTPFVDTEDGKHYIHTDVSLDGLGAVSGNVKLTIDGTTTVGESVYGGGEESGVGGNTIVTVNSGSIGVENTGTFGYRWGNVYGGGKGKIEIKDDGSSELVVKSKDDLDAGLVKGNTTVTINGTAETTNILHNVYGGGAVGSVGTFTRDANGMPTACAANTGLATVTINGGTIGHNHEDTGMVDGSSRGWEGNPNGTGAFAFLNQLAWVNNTIVTIGDATSPAEDKGPMILGSVYGGGENGHNYENAVITVNKGTIGNSDSEAANYDCGNIYGAGCGTDTYTIGEDPTKHHNPMAGIVRKTTSITVNGGHVLRNVYGGGSMGSVGTYTYDANGLPTTCAAGTGNATININGGTIGDTTSEPNIVYGHVFGGSKGNLSETEFSASVRETQVNINAGTDVKGSVFGGGEAGIVKGNVVVNMNGGEVTQDVYGGGALANTNTDNWGTNTWASGKTAASNTTTVNLKGGKILRNVYGGALGQTERDADPVNGIEALDDVEAKVYGNVLVELNNGVADDAKGCVVLGSIFGCNNLNGTPKGDVMVHVYKTQNNVATRITNAPASGEASAVEDAKVSDRYDVAAVYGGGNQSAYEPADLTNNKTEVVIDGCERTSIRQVYGGGNAACTPSTNVTVNGTFEIEELFGGGNGLDNILINGVEMPNPGANVGYKNYSTYDSEKNEWVDNTDADTKDKRQADNSPYVYGSGKASVNIYGGKIHRVFGGSNTKGNVRETAVTLLDEMGGCEFCIDEAYGGGKSASMDAEAQLLMACIPGLQAVYGGAEDADINDNVTLNITNGTFKRVFGGNNVSGTIRGAITVNVEETGCRPVIIGELYGGGNQAGYSVYGYKEVSENGKIVWKPRESDNDSGTGPANPYNDPEVNVKSFTSIGNIFGGGYGSGATMVGNPTVNINEVIGKFATDGENNSDYDETGYKGKTITVDDHDVALPSHTKGKIGAIGQVFGGGNAAKVIGDTHVNVGTQGTIDFVTKASGESAPQTGVQVVGVDIRGNVYGGGNNAEVTGSTNVQIGKEETSSGGQSQGD